MDSTSCFVAKNLRTTARSDCDHIVLDCKFLASVVRPWFLHCACLRTQLGMLLEARVCASGFWSSLGSLKISVFLTCDAV
jgi:hypothetical protein